MWYPYSMFVVARFGYMPHFAALHAKPRDRLPPFAMYRAFPGSDYYGGSVAIGLAPCRQS